MSNSTLIKYLSMCADGNLKKLAALNVLVSSGMERFDLLSNYVDNDLDIRFWLLDCFDRIKYLFPTPKEFQPRIDDLLAGYTSGRHWDDNYTFIPNRSPTPSL